MIKVPAHKQVGPAKRPGQIVNPLPPARVSCVSNVIQPRSALLRSVDRRAPFWRADNLLLIVGYVYLGVALVAYAASVVGGV